MIIPSHQHTFRSSTDEFHYRFRIFHTLYLLFFLSLLITEDTVISAMMLIFCNLRRKAFSGLPVSQLIVRMLFLMSIIRFVHFLNGILVILLRILLWPIIYFHFISILFVNAYLTRQKTTRVPKQREIFSSNFTEIHQ